MQITFVQMYDTESSIFIDCLLHIRCSFDFLTKHNHIFYPKIFNYEFYFSKSDILLFDMRMHQTHT